jgi:hypothetical protein
MKKHSLTRILLACALCAGSILPLAAAQEKKADPTKDVLGTWDVRTDDGGYTFVFKFFLENNELKGLFTGQSGEVKMQNLKIEGTKVTFLVNVGAGGQGMDINFTVFVAGDEMTGQLVLQFGEASVTGKKKK